MTKEDYKQFSCSDIGVACGFQVSAKTNDEITEIAKLHATKAHGFKEIWPETEKKNLSCHKDSIGRCAQEDIN